MRRFQKVMLALLLLGCGGLQARTVTDMLGRSVAVPDAPQKVYAPSPYGSYALYAMDPSLLAGWIFAIDAENYPYLDPRMKTLPVIGRVFGAGQSANLEVLLAQHPDLILMWAHANEFTQKEAERLGLLGAPAVYAKDETITDYVAIFRFLGRALNREARGEALAEYARKVFADVNATVASVPAEKRPRVYYAEGLDGLATECDDSIHVQLLKLAGDVDVHRCHTGSHKGFEKLSMETWQHLKAVQNRRIYFIPHSPFNWFDRPPSFMRILGLQWLTAHLYPEAYNRDIAATTREFYRLFLNVDLTPEQVTAILNGDNL
jgi:iron complex transport system substrate-binding protein